MEALLARLQTVLTSNAPLVLDSLRPGLSDEQISILEGQFGYRLPEDLKSLYRWRDGMMTNTTVGLLPGHRFIPLEEALRERTVIEKQVASARPHQRAAFSIFASHRKTWLAVLSDVAGDGYFFDPERTEQEGAFFYHFAEAGDYLWFPSVRNFLAGAIECFETGAVQLATNRTELDADWERMDKIWNRFGESRETSF
jgi:cell wall assembly regulator SMI1